MTNPSQSDVPAIPNQLLVDLKDGRPEAIAANADLYRLHGATVAHAAEQFVGGDAEKEAAMLAAITLARAGDQRAVQVAFRQLAASPDTATPEGSAHTSEQTLLAYASGIPLGPA